LTKILLINQPIHYYYYYYYYSDLVCKRVLVPSEWHFFGRNVNISEARSTDIV